MTKKNDFYRRLEESYRQYLKHGSRSTKKIETIHGSVAWYLKTQLNNNYRVVAKGLWDGKEHKCIGKYYNKKVDIAVLDGRNKVKGAIGFRFVTSNYKQNINNYFENMLGETSNLQSNGIDYSQMLIIKKKTPYYGKLKNKKENGYKRIEQINDNTLLKYQKLFSNNLKDKPLHRPSSFFIKIITTWDECAYKKAIKDEKIIKDKKVFGRNCCLDKVNVEPVNDFDDMNINDNNIKEMLKRYGEFNVFIDNFVKKMKNKQ